MGRWFFVIQVGPINHKDPYKSGAGSRKSAVGVQVEAAAWVGAVQGSNQERGTREASEAGEPTECSSPELSERTSPAAVSPEGPVLDFLPPEP